MVAMKNFEEYLNSKKCFKLICGAGNKNTDEISKLCALYAKAGCKFFDVNASLEAVRAARKGIELAGKTKECFICISIGTKDDPHLKKYIKNPKKCINCGKCKNVCPQNAVDNTDYCIGCGRCIQVCPNNALESCYTPLPPEKILLPLAQENIDCLEYHTITDNEEDVKKDWETITKLFKGPLSVCIDRSKTGNERVISRLKYMKENSSGLFIVQADGAPMSGGKDDYKTTLQSVAMAELIGKSNITPYIFMSGGTNSKTAELARQCGINFTGVAIGSYARKIVKEYLNREDFLTNPEALETAQNLINTVN